MTFLYVAGLAVCGSLSRWLNTKKVNVGPSAAPSTAPVMGNTATKFRKALINGDEGLAWQLYESNPQFKEALDPNASYGEPYQHNTALHYASRHAMTRLMR